MANRNALLGGTDFSTPSDRVKPTDLNDTFDAAANFAFGAAIPLAQLAYEQVKSDATNWTNTDFLGADIFTDSNGAKNTVDTGATDSKYDTSGAYYRSITTNGGETLTDATEYSTAANPHVLVATLTFSDTDDYIFDLSNQIKTNGIGTASCFMRFTYSDLSTADSSAQTTTSSSYVGKTYTNPNPEKIVTSIGIYLQGSLGGSIAYTQNQSATSYIVASSKVETNTIINEIIPDSIVVYGKYSLSSTGSITIDISDDGGSTFALTGKSLNTAIDTSSFSTGNIALRFHIVGDSYSDDTKLYGYGVAINKS